MTNRGAVCHLLPYVQWSAPPMYSRLPHVIHTLFVPVARPYASFFVLVCPPFCSYMPEKIEIGGTHQGAGDALIQLNPLSVHITQWPQLIPPGRLLERSH